MAAIATLWASYVPVPARGRLDAFSPFTQLLAVRPALAAALALAGLAGLVCARRQRIVAAAFLAVLVAAAAACAQIAPRALSSPGEVSAGAPRITVLVANTLASSVAPSTIVDLVRRTDADVLALPETNALGEWGSGRGIRVSRRGQPEGL
ncbi:MAG: hypothetical protein ACR2LK_08990, partial [Solirubrobacteraceae bacterium]